MICYPDASSAIDELDQKSMITRILEVVSKKKVVKTRHFILSFCRIWKCGH